MALSKNTIKRINSLRQKKYRLKYNKFIVEGDKMVLETIRQKNQLVEAVYALESWVKTNETQMKLPVEKVNVVSPSELKKISNLITPNQVLAIVDVQQTNLTNFPLASSKALYLDGVQDPGNLGTILRIADWFDMAAVFCSPDCADFYHPKVIQASMGAFLRVPSLRIDLPDLIDLADDWPVMGAALEGENIFQASLPKAGLLVVGSEGKGIQAVHYSLLSRRLTIPKARLESESLNAAVACGICCAFWAAGRL